MGVRRLIIGNWKMHKMIEESSSFVKNLLPFLPSLQTEEVGLAVPYTHIYPLAQQAKDSPLWIGAQNMNDAAEGAFTGEISGKMLKDAGAQFVLLGHSERRHLYGEDEACIHRKLKRAVEVGLRPILCIGETAEEYDMGQTPVVIERQLTEGLRDFEPVQLQQLIIAYEPVWAIGKGHSATPEVAQEAHHFCREVLAKILTEECARDMIIQYGGSVNSTNAHELLAQPDIDGLLIGGASLSLESFCCILNTFKLVGTPPPIEAEESTMESQ